MKQVISVAILGILATILLIEKTDAVDQNAWRSISMHTKIYRRGDYVKVPTTTYDPEMRNYVRVHSGANVTDYLDIFCQIDDPRVCFLYDECGNIAGVILSFLKDDYDEVDPRDYDMAEVDSFEETHFFGIPAYSVIVYFVNPCELTDCCRYYTNEIAEGIWLKIHGEWVQLERCQPNGPRWGNFYMQGCYPKLGTIFVHDFHKNVKCCRSLFLVYASYSERSLVEFGIITVGRGGSPGPRTDWYAHPTGRAFSDLIISPPKCFENLKKYGFTSLQVYLVDDPETVTCPKCKA